jgi:DNA-binding NarL/FixJ family response regulator
MTARGSFRAMVIASDRLARAGLAAILEAEGFRIAGTAELQAGAAEAAETAAADLAVVDLGPDPETSGEHLAAITDGTATLALVMDADGAAFAQRLGARGVLPRDCAPAPLAAAAAAIALGLHVAHPAVQPPWVPPSMPRGPREALSPREVEVLIHVGRGLSNKEIGRQLGISENTVKFHVNTLLGKMGARTRTEAAIIGARLGYIAV